MYFISPSSMKMHVVSHREKLLLPDAWDHKGPIEIHWALVCRNARALWIQPQCTACCTTSTPWVLWFTGLSSLKGLLKPRHTTATEALGSSALLLLLHSLLRSIGEPTLQQLLNERRLLSSGTWKFRNLGRLYESLEEWSLKFIITTYAQIIYMPGSSTHSYFMTEA